MFNAMEDYIDLQNRDKGAARYMSTKKLFLDIIIEDDVDRVWVGRRRAALDV